MTARVGACRRPGFCPGWFACPVPAHGSRQCQVPLSDRPRGLIEHVVRPPRWTGCRGRTRSEWRRWRRGPSGCRTAHPPRGCVAAGIAWSSTRLGVGGMSASSDPNRMSIGISEQWTVRSATGAPTSGLEGTRRACTCGAPTSCRPVCPRRPTRCSRELLLSRTLSLTALAGELGLLPTLVSAGKLNEELDPKATRRALEALLLVRHGPPSRLADPPSRR